MTGRRRFHITASSVLLVLLLIPILVFLARAVHWLAGTSGHRVNVHRKRIMANYLLEAGQAHALAKIKENADWREGFENVALDDVPGTYSLAFKNPEATYREGQSVNNITGNQYVDGPRGPKTVKPGTLELVVHADVGGQRVSGQRIFETKTKPLPSYGLGASGNIVLKGSVSIRGITSLANQVEVPAGIHSNSEGTMGPTIQWAKNDRSDRMEVKGTVTSSADTADAIQLQGVKGVDYNVTEIEANTAKLPVPSKNIVETVSLHSSLPSPSFNNYGTTTLTSGASYYSGNASLQGDLVLNGHDLYVDGDLRVNGTIRGDGSVYVTGKTTLKGDSEIKAEETGVALFSHGAVELRGFDGQEFLASLRRDDAQLAQALDEYDRSFQPLTVQTANFKGTNKKTHYLYEDTRSSFAPGLLDSFDQRGLRGETASFIRKQLQKQADHKLVEFQTTNTWAASRRRYSRNFTGKLYTGKPPDADFSKIGQAYFQGLIVSDHYVLTDNSISIVGSLWSTGSNTAPPVTIDGRTVQSGDIILNNGTEVVMNRELLEEPRTATRDVTDFQLKSWVK
ncbi:MAG TPA: hypothetical protein EYO33_04470 [Phycisphaerales bacterium]|nr:hypothetical protein [Phycisphaerales bacterium]